MHPRTSLVAMVAVLVLTAGVACTDDAPPDATTTAAPSPMATVPPAISPSPPASPPTTPTSTATAAHIADVERVVAAVRAGSVDSFAALMQTQSVPCSTPLPVGDGGPGNCSGAPKSGTPALPPDTVVEIFPESTCQLELDETDVRSLAARWVPALGDVYAVLRFTQPVFGPEPYYPRGADYGIVFAAPASTAEPSSTAFPTPRLVVLYEGAIVYLDAACGGGPEIFLRHPRYGTPEVLRRGPAFAP